MSSATKEYWNKASDQMKAIRLKKLVKDTLGGELPADRQVKSTMTAEMWYKIEYAERTLYIPDLEVLRSNALEIERFVESLNNFANIDFERLDAQYDWEKINEVAPAEMFSHMIPYHVGQIDVACDIETRRIEYTDNRVLLIGFAYEYRGEECVTVVPAIPENVEALQRVFNNPHINFIWHNGKFDTTRLKYLMGIEARVDNDTMLMHYTGINEKKGTHSLKHLGQLYLQAPAWEDELNAFKKKWCQDNGVRLGDFTYDMIPTEVLVPYLQRDVLATLRLYKLFLKLRRPDSIFIYKKLIHASNVYRDIELAGVEHNKEHSSIVKEQLEEEIEAARAEMDAVIEQVWDCNRYGAETGARIPKKGLAFNMRSPKQLKWLLKTLLGRDVPCTDKAALEELANHAEEYENEFARKFISAIGRVRKASKYYDTYVIGLESLVCDDGRIRCTYNLHGTETGRLSSSDPNMQNIPRNALIKNLITCRPGYRLVQLDYSQAELRVLTSLSGDPYMLHIYESGADLHDMMATKMFGPDFTKEQRVITKSLNFGIAYGRGPGSIAQMFKLSMEEATKTVADWFAAVPEVEKFISNKRKEPFQGVPCKTPFGRERHFVITSENRYHVSNEAINFPIQSIASDLTLFSVLELSDYYKSRGLDAQIVATVHDSIISEVVDDPAVIDEVINVGKEIMASQVNVLMSKAEECGLAITRCPFRADAETGYTWGDVEKWSGIANESTTA